MALRVNVSDPSTGTSVDVDIEPWNTIDELVESVASYWNKDLGAYVLRHNNNIPQGGTTLGSIQLQEGDIFEFIMDPEGG